MDTGSILEDEDFSNRQVERVVFNTLAALSTLFCLVTVVSATLAGMFSIRLALRGGVDAVENAVQLTRDEYKRVLRLFICGIESFILAMAAMGPCK